ncbi:RDD family protein [Stieleria neptunia]|uniref:RDD family protein n=1 Tax=Stieleria neptunia TaxID=2527979 RepID=A0A518HW06_9BACT|nr:RDD family protein [Stieleria neptunia]QDV45031.1 RDD family protein [Stieleria neptunia]
MNDPSHENEPVNPYAPTDFASTDAFVDQNAPPELASRLSRLGAIIIDGFLMMFIIFPIQIATDYTGRAMTGEVGLLEQLAMSVLGMIVFLILNGYLLVTRGQSIGKLAAGIRIVDAETNELISFTRIYVYRYLWTLPFTFITLIIPGTTDDVFISLVFLVDALMIFRSDKRCLHDLIAGSKVVKVQRT